MAPSDEVIEPKPAKISWIWIVLALVLAAASVGALWLWQHRRPPVSGACSPGDVMLSIGRTEDKTVTTYVHAVLTNISKRTCTLNGYPVVSVLDAKGTNYATGDAQRDEQVKPQTIIVGPGEQAYTVVAFPKPTGFPAGACLTEATTLRLYLPADAIVPGMTPLTTQSTRSACPGLSATALQAGS
jgi:hypothetical protein